MKIVITLGLLIFTFNNFAQECSCTEQFNFVQHHFEENNPAFQKIKANKSSFKKYKKSVKKLLKEMSLEKNDNLCNMYFDKYVKLLKDHHSRIDLNLQRKDIDFSSEAAIESFKKSEAYRSFEKKAIDASQLISELSNKPLDEIEGIYSSEMGVDVAIVKNGAVNYDGIVVKQNSLLDEGHVLFRLTKNTNDSYACIYNLGLLGFTFNEAFMDNVRLQNGALNMIGFYKMIAQHSENLWEFKELNENTYYLAIKSFDYWLKPQLDSLYTQVIPLIEQKKHLVLDIRNNGGGSEENYFELLPLLYTRPMKVDEVQVWVSPDNIKAYENYQNPDEELVTRMKKAKPYSFIVQKENATKELIMEGARWPEKVVLLYNNGTGSAAEGLITYAVQSDKVTTMGENSGGYIGYGNLMSTEVPCGKFIVTSTTTKYNNNSQYEFVGIPPMVPLNPNLDWIQKALEFLK